MAGKNLRRHRRYSNHATVSSSSYSQLTTGIVAPATPKVTSWSWVASVAAATCERPANAPTAALPNTAYTRSRS